MGVVLDVECCCLAAWKTYNGARQAAQRLIDDLALTQSTEAWCSEAIALIQSVRQDPRSAQQVLTSLERTSDFWPPKDVVQDGQEWSVRKLFSQRLGKQDSIFWWA